MRILLVRPRPDPETIGLQHVMLVEPLELEVLAGTLGVRDEAAIVDLTLERRDLKDFLREHEPDLLGVTGYITNVPAMKALCRQAKAWRPSVVTVAGGVHLEVCPEDLDDPAVDFRVVRNAAKAFPRLLDHVRGEGPLPPGVLRPGEALDRSTLPDFDWTFPRPARHLVDRYRPRYFYIFHDRVALLKTAFGCPFSCSFCLCREVTGHRYFERPLEGVLDELAGIEQREVYIVDDDFLVSRARVLAFAEGVRSRGIDKHYLVYGRADFVAANEGLLRELRDVGLRTVIVGFESFMDADLRSYGKGIAASTNEEAMGVLRRLGLDCFATIILPPHWSEQDFASCGRTIRRLGIRYVNLQPLTPLPGTGQAARQEDLLIDRQDFPRWDLAHVAIRPERMSPEGFYRQIVRLYMDTLFRPRDLLDHARRYPFRMWLRMLAGTWRVRRQYLRKTREARALALPAPEHR